MITVFTPTYNRAHLLPRVYESLCRQTFKDFEWVIVDDGSSDDTRSVVEKFSVLGFELSGDKAQPFNPQPSPLTPDFKTQNSKLKTNSIRYFYQENGGKHRAINRGVQEARGELFFIVDSDDWLPDDALKIVAQQYEYIKGDASFAGVVGLDCFSDGRVVASNTFYEVLECSEIDFRNKYHVKGDMKEVFRIDVLREIPFPEIEREKFCPEDLVWHRIARKYKFRYFNQVIYSVEYQPTGLSSSLRRLRMNSPYASVIHYSEYNEFDISTKQKIRNAINYWRFWFCLPDNRKRSGETPKLCWLWFWTKPIGWFMHLNDLRLTK